MSQQQEEQPRQQQQQPQIESPNTNSASQQQPNTNAEMPQGFDATVRFMWDEFSTFHGRQGLPADEAERNAQLIRVSAQFTKLVRDLLQRRLLAYYKNNPSAQKVIYGHLSKNASDCVQSGAPQSPCVASVKRNWLHYNTNK